MADGDYPQSHAAEAYMALLKENVKLTKALQFYAEPATWGFPGQHYEDAPSHEDRGKVARDALGRS